MGSDVVNRCFSSEHAARKTVNLSAPKEIIKRFRKTHSLYKERVRKDFPSIDNFLLDVDEFFGLHSRHFILLLAD